MKMPGVDWLSLSMRLAAGWMRMSKASNESLARRREYNFSVENEPRRP